MFIRRLCVEADRLVGGLPHGLPDLGRPSGHRLGGRGTRAGSADRRSHRFSRRHRRPSGLWRRPAHRRLAGDTHNPGPGA